MADIPDDNAKELESYYQALLYRDTYYKADLYFGDKDYTSEIDKRVYPKRKKYKKALEFFEKGAKYRQRLMLAANRSGKTTAAAYEIMCHATGHYPDWWTGKRYAAPQHWWICGKTKETLKENLQPLLLGPMKAFGSGMIPRMYLDIDSMVNAKKTSTKIQSFRVRHITGKHTNIEFKSYDQGRDAFEGTERCVWFDEEPPEEIYTEGLTRTMTGDCMVIITFTPLEGLTRVIQTFTNGGDFTEGEKGTGKYVINQTWDDVPHLSLQDREDMLASYPEYQRLARSAGIPSLGEGAVWPVNDKTFLIEPIEIPKHWKRVAGFDFGWTKPTAILWCAIDPESEIHYIYSEHYFSEQPPLFHAQAIEQRNKSAGFPIPIVCDPSGGGRSMTDGAQARLLYETDYHIPMIAANNAKEVGLSKTLEMFNAGKIKVFSTCVNFMKEFRAYQRNKKGEAVGEDHLMDDLRYIAMSGFDNATTKAYYDASVNRTEDQESEDWEQRMLPWNYQ